MSSEHVASARKAGLRYVSHEQPGILRVKRGKSWSYVHPSGRIIRDAATIKRIRSLVIPPAYQKVWICTDPRGHIQAIGFDARGRKQYRYHPEWRAVRDANKYQHVIEFAKVLPMVRRITSQHIRTPGLHRDKVLATVVRLLEKTLIRVGNEEYARENKSYGLTTLRRKHVAVRGSKIQFEFKGKSKVHHTIDLEDRRLAKIVRSCQDLPGQELFQYLDETGARHSVSSQDVNSYIQEITAGDFTAKDFRTWAGTVLSAIELRNSAAFKDDKEAKRNILQAIERVSKRLGNTKAICRKCYIHPAIFESYLKGKTISPTTRSPEKAVMRLLKRHQR